MIGPDDYPVYNHKQRPAIGRDHLGNLYYNCFSISLEKDKAGTYIPYLFSDFLQQYNQYKDYQETCQSCIYTYKIFTFDNVDRSAIEKKIIQRDYLEDECEIDESSYYYCPLINEIISNSKLNPEAVNSSNKNGSAKPISAILGISNDGIYASSKNNYAWDDDYLFEFTEIGTPKKFSICSIYQKIISSEFTNTKAERSLLILWTLAMFQVMELTRESGKKIYLEDVDFNQIQSKLFAFIFPIPQVWVYIIPKPPPGVDWKQWEQQYQQESLPQRVDFLFTYQGKRHIIELDDIGHYAENSSGKWLASEPKYRKTLSDTRWLRRCGFEVHRLTNQEILELYNPDISSEPNIEGFIRLMNSEGLELENLVFLKKLQDKENESAKPTKKENRKFWNGLDDIPF